MSLQRSATVLLTLALLLGSKLHAQAGVVRGRVLGGDSATALAGVEVSLPAIERATRTNADGSFVLDRLPAGTHQLQARSLGFAPQTRPVTVGAGADTTVVELTLTARALELGTVEVKATAAAPTRRAFERDRARQNGGAFVDDSSLARGEQSPMSNVLRRIPGAAVIRIQSTRGAYNVLGSRRGGQSMRGGDKHCYYQIYIDGQRRYAPAALNIEPPPDIDEFKVADYEAIEIYRGPAQTPVEYSGTGAACGTALFWSRSRR